MRDRPLPAWTAYVARCLAEGVLDWRSGLHRLVLQPLVYLLVFSGILGGAAGLGDGGTARTVAPGIVAIVVMNASLAVVGGMFTSGYYFRVMEAWLLGPISLRGFVAAQVVGATLMAAVAGLAAMALVWLLLGFVPAAPITAIAAIVFGGAAFALIFVIGFTLPRTPDRAQEVLSFILMPMMFLGCTFYTWDSLAGGWRVVALAMPTTYLSEALRAAYRAESGLGGAAMAAGGAAVLMALAVLADLAFHRRFRDFPW